MSEPYGIEALLTYAPLSDTSSSEEENSGRLQDLYACTDTAQFFTILQALVNTEQRSSRSAKQFFCPRCPKSALNIASQPNGDTLITCLSCGWDSRRTGVTTVSELLQRDGNPYPWISNKIRTLTMRAEAHFQDDADARDEFQLDASVASPSQSMPNTDSARLLRSRASLRRISRDSSLQHTHQTNSAAENAERFTKEQEKKEARVFSSWIPENTPTTTTRQEGRPDGDISELLGTVNLDDVVELEDRVCNATWWKRDMAARRRVPRPRVIIRSPFGQRPIAMKAERFIPCFQARLRDKCDETGHRDKCSTQLTLRVRNRFASAQLEVGVRNACAADQYAKATLLGGSDGELVIKPFSFRDDCKDADMVHGKWMCGQVATLDVRIQYKGSLPDADRVIGGCLWQLRIYARHAKHEHS